MGTIETVLRLILARHCLLFSLLDWLTPDSLKMILQLNGEHFFSKTTFKSVAQEKLVDSTLYYTGRVFCHCTFYKDRLSCLQLRVAGFFTKKPNHRPNLTHCGVLTFSTVPTSTIVL